MSRRRAPPQTPMDGLAAFPHVQARVLELWGQAAGRDYLAGLTDPHDRDPPRSGFPLSAFQAILALIEAHDAEYPHWRRGGLGIPWRGLTPQSTPKTQRMEHSTGNAIPRRDAPGLATEIREEIGHLADANSVPEALRLLRLVSHAGSPAWAIEALETFITQRIQT